MATVLPTHVECRTGTCLLRSAEAGDAEQLVHLIRRLSSETEYMSREPHEITKTVDEERDRILRSTASNRDLILVAVVDSQMVGSLGFTGQPLARFRHQGELGVGVLRGFWGQGIGSALLRTLCQWADSVGVIKLSLHVTSDNESAVRLYQRAGFVIEGRLRMDTKHTDGFHDSYVMARVHIPGQDGA